jgi:DNA-binding LacI/PurR family transcriptional regulator
VATVSDVARLAGVSPGTVSRVLNGDETLRVRTTTRDRVVEAARALDYTPNHAARSLRRSRAGILGIAVHDTTNPIYSAILDGAQRAAVEAGCMLVIADVDALATDEAVFRRVIASGALDGLLLQRAGGSADAFVARVASARVPFVLINEPPGSTGDSVAADDVGAARLGTEHLLDLGHRSIGLLRTTADHARARQRARGWSDAIESRGLTPNPDAVRNGGHTIREGYDGMIELLDSNTDVTAVLVSNVLSGLGALRACADRGVRVPDELSVVAIHDTELCEASVPRLTVVALPLAEMGRAGVELLLDRMNGGAERQLVLTTPAPRLVVRESTAAPR